MQREDKRRAAEIEGVANELGQATAEYALVLLIAGLVVGVFATFVKSGAFGDMFQTIVSSLLQHAKG